MKSFYPKVAGALFGLLGAAVLMMSQSTMAAEKSPQDLVEKTTAELFATVKKHSSETRKSDAYYAEVEKTLDAVVDFPFIAKAVMRKSAKNATQEQVEKFTAVFKNGLIRTYAKGIANYADSEIKTLPVKTPADSHRVSVNQEVNDKGTIHTLSYTMRQNDTGDWKLINVVLNGVNLGDSFTSQFDQAMIKNGNDVDKVIANWLSAS